MSTGVLNTFVSPINIVIEAAYSYKRNHGVEPFCICISEDLRCACEVWAEENIFLRKSEPRSNKLEIEGFPVFVLDSFTGMKAEGAGIAE